MCAALKQVPGPEVLYLISSVSLIGAFNVNIFYTHFVFRLPTRGAHLVLPLLCIWCLYGHQVDSTLLRAGVDFLFIIPKLGREPTATHTRADLLHSSGILPKVLRDTEPPRDNRQGRVTHLLPAAPSDIKVTQPSINLLEALQRSPPVRVLSPPTLLSVQESMAKGKEEHGREEYNSFAATLEWAAKHEQDEEEDLRRPPLQTKASKLKWDEGDKGKGGRSGGRARLVGQDCMKLQGDSG
ncbi:hypothetical protein C8R43DRAFT_951239 [Mycena crocata]|nr:hypothetical protein C8R43DRAFT_951239 [Mycena crocata]